jgi:hypothetical protein
MIATALIMGTIWLYVLRKFTRVNKSTLQSYVSVFISIYIYKIDYCVGHYCYCTHFTMFHVPVDVNRVITIQFCIWWNSQRRWKGHWVKNNLNIHMTHSSYNSCDISLTIMSFIPFILSLVYVKLAFDNRHRISKTVSVIEVTNLWSMTTIYLFILFYSICLACLWCIAI